MQSVIEVHPHGVLFRYPIPLGVAGKIDKIAAVILGKSPGLLSVHNQIGRRLGGMAVATTRGEVGISSQAIVAHFWRAIPSPRNPRPPMDSDDFRRCHLLIELAEANGHALRSEIATNPPPPFARVAPHWERLTELYLCGDYPAVNRMLSEVSR